MTKQTLVIAIFIALLLLWAAETLGMHKTRRLLNGALDVGMRLLD